jgi:hypothetical protein
MACNEKWWRIYRRTRRGTPAEHRRVSWCWRYILHHPCTYQRQ